MTIAILLNTSWNVFNFRLGLIKSLQSKDFKVVVVAPRDEYTEKLIPLGVQFENVAINLKGQNPFQDLMLVKQYHEIFKKVKPDVALTFTIKPNIYGNIAAKFSNTAVISNITGLGTIFIKKSLATFIATLLYKWSFSRSRVVFFQNRTDQRFFQMKKLVNSSQGALISGSGVDVGRFHFEDRKIDNTKLKFLFVGRIIKDKGVVEFLHAAKTLRKDFPHLEFFMVGKTGYDNRTALTEKEFNSYLLEGGIKHFEHTDNIIDVYKKMDIIVLPSYREGMSRTLLEAASMKMPIITTNVPGCREVVRDGVNGFLVKPKDEKDLIEKMSKISRLSNHELLEMGKESREIVLNQFSEDAVVGKYMEAINHIIG